MLTSWETLRVIRVLRVMRWFLDIDSLEVSVSNREICEVPGDKVVSFSEGRIWI